MNKTKGKKDPNRGNYATPPELITALQKKLGIKFTLDPCATKANAKARRYFTAKDDGLAQKWTGHVYVNPPYNRIKPWIIKALDELAAGHCQTVTFLIPARTETAWFRMAHPHLKRHLFPFPRINFIPPKGVEQKNTNDTPSQVLHLTKARAKAFSECWGWQG